MTEQIESAIDALELARDTRFFIPKNKELETAIRSLNAWEEVLQELEEERAFEDSLGNDEARVELDMCIRIINQKLSEVKNEQSK